MGLSSSAGHTGYTATIHLSGTADCVSASIIAVKGFAGTSYGAAPFDTYSTLPIVASATGSSVPGAAVSTNAVNSMLIGACAVGNNQVASNGSGYTNSASGLFILNGGQGIGSFIQQKTVSSPQSSAADDISPGTANGWIWISDALAQNGGLVHQMPSMGFG